LLVALTGRGTPDDIAQLKASDFDHIFVKPLDPAELLRALDAHGGRTPAPD
jgi:DNA-binding response OmpR family regulator